MIIEKWDYTDTIVRCIEYDTFYCDILQRIVDLGWDEYVSMVHDWIRVLNKVNAELHKINIKTENIEMNPHSFKLIKLKDYTYYNNETKKISSMYVKINDNIDNNVILLTSDGNTYGKIIIIHPNKT